jgi:ribosomal protein L11 methyltransferase
LRDYPAIDVRGPADDRLLAMIDDLAATAIDERDGSVRVFFSSTDDRDRATTALAGHFSVAAIDVPDEDWARRSQEHLGPISVGRVTVFPTPGPRVTNPDTISIVVVPSMGFGTGHHATTRLCLAALQTMNLSGRLVLDVGTGSGLLAMAADRLGAARAVGIDNDADAIQSARENLVLNPDARHVIFELGDLRETPLPAADVVTANLTGALLLRASRDLLAPLRRGGTLIVSGLLVDERDAVVRALTEGTAGGIAILWERAEDEWVALAVKKR